MFTINDRDIQFAESYFGIEFNDDQKKVIKNLESVDVRACPGSGKTTTLAAKLLILLKKMPIKGQKGICVITHTNVAVDTIKGKLGIYGKLLSRYPHHIGTIQSFVDKFLTIPAFRSSYSTVPVAIDDDSYKEILLKKSENLSKNTKFFLSRQNVELDSLTYNLTEFAVAKSITDIKPFVSKSSPTYLEIYNLKLELLKLGYLKFSESYAIGLRHLKKNINYSSILCKRFPLVFIDEMQDMASYQAEVLSSAFSENDVVLQKIGDSNQAIYNVGDESAANWTSEKFLTINQSCRLSSAIAEKVFNVCPDPLPLKGVDSHSQINPKVIIYNKSSIYEVKKVFGNLILNLGLLGAGNNSFKAIGFRRSDARLNLASYFESSSSSFFHSSGKLSSFLSFHSEILSPYQMYSFLGSVFPKIHKMVEGNTAVKNHIKVRYWEYIENKNPEVHQELRIKIGQWCKKNNRDKVSFLKSFREWILDYYLPRLAIHPNDTLLEFLSIDNIEEENSNVYLYKEKGKEIPIHISTIHGVKGETHCATLYLETFNRCYDIEKLIPFFLGETRKSIRNKHLQRLRLGYVAITRATHLLCIAVEKDRFPEHYNQGMSDFGWDILDLTKHQSQ